MSDIPTPSTSRDTPVESPEIALESHPTEDPSVDSPQATEGTTDEATASGEGEQTNGKKKLGNPAFGPNQPKHYSGKKGRTGKSPNSRNCLRHGMRGSKLPKDCKYVENAVNALRRNMEAAVLKARGTINILDASAINSILKWERHGMLAAHWLRHEIDTLCPSDRLRFSGEIAKASDCRDKAIRSLGLDAAAPMPWITVEHDEPAEEDTDD